MEECADRVPGTSLKQRAEFRRVLFMVGVCLFAAVRPDLSLAQSFAVGVRVDVATGVNPGRWQSGT